MDKRGHNYTLLMRVIWFYYFNDLFNFLIICVNYIYLKILFKLSFNIESQKIVDVEADLKDLQSTIKSDEKIFRNWNMQNENKRAKIRNEAATMILKSKSQPQIKSLDQPKMKKIRYLLDPATNT